MALLTVDSLSKTYKPSRGGLLGKANKEGAVLAVDDVSFEIERGELFTLLGPSGCGKTTTLRSVAGLERPDGGRIALGGRVLFDGAAKVNVSANKRGLGMAFQSYAIWPHLTVFGNVAFPLLVAPKRSRLGRAEIRERVRRVLEVTELAHMIDRPATKLSGGQQQRLALSRAIVTEPDLVLLDEPLSNLDAKLRESMRFELKRLKRELGLTSVYVTHDQSEALVMSTRIAVMNEGRIVQVGRPREIYTRPANRFVAEFVGVTNLLTGTVTGSGPVGTQHVQTSVGRILTSQGADLAVGEPALITIRPENIDLEPDSRGGMVANELQGTVETRAFLGDCIDHIVRLGEETIRVRSNPSKSFAPGTDVYLTISPDSATVVAE
jgi:iron(III) transport system ATP-binding protein